MEDIKEKTADDKDEIILSLITRNKELNKINEKLKDETEKDYTSVYLKGIYDERDNWKSKIKKRYEQLKHYDYIETNELLKFLDY